MGELDREFFGFSVGIDNDTAMIGAYGAADNNGTRSGAVYVFTRLNGFWELDDKLFSNNTGIDGRFGIQLSLQGNRALIGANQSDQTGEAYLFENDNNFWSQTQRLQAGDASSNDNFGQYLDMDSGNIVIAATHNDDTGLDSGTVYFFQLEAQTEEIDPDDIDGDGIPNEIDEDLDGDNIPNTIDADIDGDGLPNLVENSLGLDAFSQADGLADLDGDGWSNADEYRFGTGVSNADDHPGILTGPDSQKVFASDGLAEDLFGVRVDIDGDKAIIGAYLKDDKGADSGAAYVFVRQNNRWVEQAKLIPRDSASGDRFGYSVAIDGDKALVGAYLDDNENGNDAGSVYVFVRENTQWIEQAKLLASDGAGGDQFSSHLVLKDNTALIGSPLDDDLGTNSGSVYVFEFNENDAESGWTEQAKLLSSDGSGSDVFGVNIAFDGNRALIGAQLDDDRGSNSGSAYIFSRDTNGWTEEAKLIAERWRS